MRVCLETIWWVPDLRASKWSSWLRYGNMQIRFLSECIAYLADGFPLRPKTSWLNFEEHNDKNIIVKSLIIKDRFYDWVYNKHNSKSLYRHEGPIESIGSVYEWCITQISIVRAHITIIKKNNCWTYLMTAVNGAKNSNLTGDRFSSVVHSSN